MAAQVSLLPDVPAQEHHIILPKVSWLWLMHERLPKVFWLPFSPEQKCTIRSYCGTWLWMKHVWLPKPSWLYDRFVKEYCCPRCLGGRRMSTIIVLYKEIIQCVLHWLLQQMQTQHMYSCSHFMGLTRGGNMPCGLPAQLDLRLYASIVWRTSSRICVE